MNKKTDPLRNPLRLEEIARLAIYDEEAQRLLQDLVKSAALEFDLPTSMITIVLDEAQLFAVAEGDGNPYPEAGGIPVEWSFCSRSVITRKPFIVEDSLNDPTVSENPLVKEKNIRCYAGYPMITESGFVIGNFCVVGENKRVFRKDELKRLKQLAKQAVFILESNVKS